MKGSELKMKHTREEILKALRVIKETCEEYEDCEVCPLFTNDTCNVTRRRPEKWEINDNVEVWRGLL